MASCRYLPRRSTCCGCVLLVEGGKVIVDVDCKVFVFIVSGIRVLRAVILGNCVLDIEDVSVVGVWGLLRSSVGVMVVVVVECGNVKVSMIGADGTGGPGDKVVL